MFKIGITNYFYVQYSVGAETNKKQDGILIIPFMLLITIDREKYNRRYPLCCWYRVLNYIKDSYFAENDHYRHRYNRRGMSSPHFYIEGRALKLKPNIREHLSELEETEDFLGFN